MDDGTPNAGAALLERALGYALCAVRPVTPGALERPTPCGRWDLRALLWHTNDSLAALCEGVEDGYVALGPAVPGRDGVRGGVRVGERGGDPGRAPEGGTYGGSDDPATAFRTRASRLMGAWAASTLATALLASPLADRAADVYVRAGLLVALGIVLWAVNRAFLGIAARRR
nr:maleylpyruvate isomerase N-terminal domain-containing protein [Streptomyces abyssalis]